MEADFLAFQLSAVALVATSYTLHCMLCLCVHVYSRCVYIIMTLYVPVLYMQLSQLMIDYALICLLSITLFTLAVATALRPGSTSRPVVAIATCYGDQYKQYYYCPGVAIATVKLLLW